MSIMESWWPWSQLIKSEIGVLCRYCVVLPWISLPVLPVLPVSHMSHLDHVTCPYFSGSSSSSVFFILVIQGIKRIYTATIAPVIWNNRVCVQVFRLLWKCRPVTRSAPGWKFWGCTRSVIAKCGQCRRNRTSPGFRQQDYEPSVVVGDDMWTSCRSYFSPFLTLRCPAMTSI